MPNHKWSLTADYNWDLGRSGSLLASLSYSYTGERHALPLQQPEPGAGRLHAAGRQPDLRPGFRQLSVTVYVENALDEIMVQEIEANDWEEGYYVGGRLTDARFVGLVVRWEM